MRLSTSSSKTAVLRGALAVTAILFVLYTVGIVFMKPKVVLAQSQYQDNMMKLQNFVYENKNASVVIVGSSMAARMVPSYFSNTNITVIALAGGNALTGLSIIEKAGAAPKVVLVEINEPLFSRPSDTETVDKIFTPGLYELRSFLPSLQERYQPATVFLNLLYSLRKQAPDETAEVVDKGTYSNMLEMQKKEFSTLPKLEIVQKNLSNLAGLLEGLSKRGVGVVFFEMPYDKELLKLPRGKFVRTEMEARFPSSRYRYLAYQNYADFVTTDGLHLTKESIHKMIAYIEAEFASLQ